MEGLKIERGFLLSYQSGEDEVSGTTGDCSIHSISELNPLHCKPPDLDLDEPQQSTMVDTETRRNWRVMIVSVPENGLVVAQ